MSTDRYVSPLSERYASKEMQYIFSPDMKFRTWRRLWIALAETEKELGLNITQEQIDELKAHKDDINYDVAKERERQVRHDVMSHVYAYGVQCPKAKGIIHLGATSCYVGDNTDIIVMAEALKLVQKKLVNVIAELSKFADKYKEQPTLAFTHFQPAQPTTVGKRATLWTQEFLMDLEDLDFRNNRLRIIRKGGKEDFVYFGDEVAESLYDYYAERKNIVTKEGHEHALFLSIQKRRISVQGIENLVSDCARHVTTIKHITPHKLRSTYGTSLYRETGDIYLVAEVLGHNDVNTTRKHYAALEEDRKRRAASAVSLRKE